jgi:hypothetical protein
MWDALLLGGLAACAGFLAYEVFRLRYASRPLPSVHSGLLPPRKGFENLYSGMSDIDTKVRVERMESALAGFEKRIEKQEKVISRLLSELSS